MSRVNILKLSQIRDVPYHRLRVQTLFHGVQKHCRPVTTSDSSAQPLTAQ